MVSLDHDDLKIPLLKISSSSSIQTAVLSLFRSIPIFEPVLNFEVPPDVTRSRQPFDDVICPAETFKHRRNFEENIVGISMFTDGFALPGARSYAGTVKTKSRSRSQPTLEMLDDYPLTTKMKFNTVVSKCYFVHENVLEYTFYGQFLLHSSAHFNSA